MSEIRIEKDSKLIKVLASQARGERLDSNVIAEANNIMTDLAQDLNPTTRHQIAQTVAFSVDRLQQNALPFLNNVADIKNIAYGDKAAFNVKTGHVKAYIQAKGSTTARSMLGGKQVLVNTKEIAARPAIHLMDLKTGRVQAADIIREANEEITAKKLKDIETVLHGAINQYSSPFYATATGVNQSMIDAQIATMRRMGPVTITGDFSAVSRLSNLSGMAMNTTTNQFSNEMINEYAANGFIGNYKGNSVVSMENTLDAGTTNPTLNPDWLYFIVGGLTNDARNLKVVNEGEVMAIEDTNINSLDWEINLATWFGSAFVIGDYPTIAAFEIN